MDGELVLELRECYDLSGDTVFYNPEVIVKRWQNLIVEIGAKFFSGSDKTTIGLFDKNDQWYGAVKYFFNSQLFILFRFEAK